MGNILLGTKPCSSLSETLRVCLCLCSFFFFFGIIIFFNRICLHLYQLGFVPFLAGKLIIISNNCPPLRKSEIEYYAMLAKIGVHHYNGSKHLIDARLPFSISKYLILAFVWDIIIFLGFEYIGSIVKIIIFIW